MWRLTKESSAWECYVPEEAFRRVLQRSKKVQFRDLLNLLTNIFFYKDKDTRIWKLSSSQKLSVKEFYLALEGCPQPRSSLCACVAGFISP